MPESGRAQVQRRRLAVGIVVLSSAWLLSFALLTLQWAPLTGDEAMLLSASASLAERGVLGVRALEGVHGASDHYFLSLPGQHVLHYVPFRWLGAGIGTGRAVSLLMVVLLVGSAVWVAGRRAGMLGAVTAVVLLVFWRNGIVASSHGLALAGVSRSVRYDATVAALMAATLPLLASWVKRPRGVVELGLGGVTGAAMVTHFPAWVLPIVILGVWVAAERPRPPLASLGRIVLVAGLVVLPYVAWVLANAADAAAQFEVVHGGRARAIGGVVALWASVGSEPDRYGALLRAPGLGPPLFVAAVLVMAVFAVASLRRLEIWGRVAAVHLLAYLAFLTLLEPTKAPIYALPLLVPTIVLVSGLLAGWLGRSGRVRWAGGFVLMAVVLEGAVAYAHDARAMRGLRTYDAMAASIAASVPAEPSWIGPMRWSWAFRHDPYTALFVLGFRAESGDAPDNDLRPAWRHVSPTVLIETPEWHADVARLAEPGRRFVVSVVERCSSVLHQIDDAAYGPLVIRTIDRACVEGLPGERPPR